MEIRAPLIFYQTGFTGLTKFFVRFPDEKGQAQSSSASGKKYSRNWMHTFLFIIILEYDN